MVKLYITTDRTFRYNVRSNNKHMSELHNLIKKKTDELHTCTENNRQNYNLVSRTNGFNRMIYSAYTELYNKYINLINDLTKYRNSLQETEDKLKDTNEKYENLLGVYNENVSKCEKLKNKDIEIKEETKM